MNKLTHLYHDLGDKFSRKSQPEVVSDPKLLLWNDSLSTELGISKTDAAKYFSGSQLLAGSEPISMAYSGHQFGQFNPHLGDGRAHLLGELLDGNHEIQEIQLKGSGRTPFSRNGDGKCGIKPAVREFVMSKAMYELGIPTTRCLAVVSTGEDIFRQTSTPGAVVTRVANSHLRVGTFEYFAARGMHSELNALVDLCIDRHYPEIDKNESKYINLLEYIIDKQVDLIVNWMRVGFIHGVMNTDNTLLSGQTIDYGPCAMLGVYDPQTVFSSIDHQGRYAFGNQPRVMQWNMARFAETLIPLIADGEDEAIQLVSPLIENYEKKYKQSYSLMMAQKLGFKNNTSEVASLSNELLEIMLKKQLDYTQTFVLLADSLQDSSEFKDNTLSDWHKKWLKTLRNNNQSTIEANFLMKENNPLVIPRNHHIEQILENIEKSLNPTEVKNFLKVINSPYELLSETKQYQNTDAAADLNYQTFCGT